MDLRSKKMSNERTTVAAPLKYDAFWHLQAIGLLPPPSTTDAPPLPGAKRTSAGIWEKVPQQESLVAIIDTGVSTHPYLTGRLLEPGKDAFSGAAAFGGQSQNAADMNFNFDLTAAPTLPANTENPAKFPSTIDWEAVLEGWGLCPKSGGESWQLIVKKLVNDNIDKISFNSGAPVASNQKFSAHGTSCAGLVAASSERYATSRTNPGQDNFVPPYYSGVDPDSRVMSVTTSFAPRPDLLTLAFVLAAGNKADVILFPRGLPREIALAAALKNPAMAALMTEEEKLAAQPWLALKETILAVSRKIPVVCAAGNESENGPIAPACFADDDNGIISVAAVSYYGHRSSYSNFGDAITVAAPSDDAEIFNRDQARLDKTDRFYAEHPYAFFLKNLKVADVPFGEANIRSIDVPGAFGFSDTNSNADAKLWTEPESFFTDFGGTSAAASIVAGVASLMQRAAKAKNGGKPVSGVEIRKLIAETARKENDNLLHLSGKKLSLDKVDDENLSFLQSFGAGLIAADNAVNKILDPSWTPPAA
jgi:subtilisin family serine protease